MHGNDQPQLYSYDHLCLNRDGSLRLVGFLEHCIYQFLQKIANEGGNPVVLNNLARSKRNIETNVNKSMCRRQTSTSRSGGSQGHVSVQYTNERSLIPKRDELFAQIITEEPDVVAIAETWVNSSQWKTDFSVEGYASFHKNRKTTKEGGIICFV